MQKILEKITQETEAFIEQRKNLVMVMSCADNEAGLVMKVIQDIEQAGTSDAYLFFGDDFTELDTYVEATIEQLHVQHQFANDQAKQEELPLLPELPRELKDTKLPPLQRLGKAMIFTRTLIPEIGTHNIIWILFPQMISDRKAWHELVSAFAPKNGVQDGMQGLRIIFRDLADTLTFSPQMAHLPRIQFNQTDMTPEAIEDTLDETISDKSLSDEIRFSAMLQRAMIDSAHSRFDKAYDAFKYMLGYYQQTKNHAVQSVIINAVGDIFRRQNKFNEANHVYETAIEPSVKSGSATVLHNVTLNLAENEYSRQDYEQAAKYYDQVDQLATKMLYADGKIYALNQQAECAANLNNWEKAIIHWESAANFCRVGEYFDDLKIELQKLLAVEQHLSSEQKNKYRKELQQLEAEEQLE